MIVDLRSAHQLPPIDMPRAASSRIGCEEVARAEERDNRR